MHTRGGVRLRAAACVLALLAAAICSGCAHGASSVTQPSVSAVAAPNVAASSDIASSNASSSAASPSVAKSAPRSGRSTRHQARAHRRAARLPAGRIARANAAIGRLTGYLGAGGVSIEVQDPKSGATFSYGAHRGMLSGSIAKLYILEVLLRQHHGKDLDPAEQALAVRMIESSDNDAADDLYEQIGEGPALRAAAKGLGIAHTIPGPGIDWGFNRTAASDYITLLHNLIRPGRLKPNARSYALGLMAHVETDQRWGVSAAADNNTLTRLKNGWLSASPDDDRWLVNSVGIITAHGRRLLVAVLTQHGQDFASGIALVQRLAEISVRAVTG